MRGADRCPSMSSRPLSIGLAAATLLLAACGEEKVATYRVPKEKDPEFPMAAAGDAGTQPAPAAGASMADTSVPTAGGDQLVWQAPASWTQKAASAMRKGSYTVHGDGGDSDLSITAFPGDVGGELANVNRWRGQVGLTPLGPAELDGSVSRIDSNGLTFTVVELSAKGDPGAKSILGAMVPFQGSTWFFKLTGSGTLVRGSKQAFLDFLHTVKAPASP
jgi:hypothetical protein